MEINKNFILNNYLTQKQKYNTNFFIKYNQEINDFLDKEIPFFQNQKMSEKVYAFVNNLVEFPKCECGKYVKFNSFMDGYYIFCSAKCSMNSKSTTEKREKTNLEKYGVKNTFQSEEIKEKIYETNIERHGVKHALQNKDILQKSKETLQKNYGVTSPILNEEIKKKTIETIKEKYNVDNVMKNENIKNKVFETNKLKYGFKCSLNNPKVKIKTFKTMEEKYNTKYPLQNQELKEKALKTNKERYDFEQASKNKDIKQKIINTNKERYNANSPMQNKDIQEKLKKTNLEKYNVEYSILNKDVKEKAFKTMKEKYNSKYPLQNQQIKEKFKNTLKNKYGVDNIAQIPFVKENRYKKFYDEKLIKFRLTPNFSIEEYNGYKNNSYEFFCHKCNKIFLIDTHKASKGSGLKLIKCPECENIVYRGQEEVRIFVENLMNEKCESNREILKVNEFKKNNKEIDIFVKSQNFGIEYNGIFFHSFGISKKSMFNNYEQEAKNKYNHKLKTDLAENYNLNLIQIFENEWILKKEIVKSIIKAKLGKIDNKIFARKCKIEIISSEEANKFLEINHIQGSDNSSIKIGLKYNQELVSILTFGKSRFNNNYEYEIYRFCNKLDTNVVGGFSKLLKYFLNNFNPQSIITYADRRYSNGNLYSNNGFNLVNKSKPNYFYFDEKKPLKLFSRIQFQKHKLKDKLEKFDKNLTETENMYRNGYRKIYDSGNLVFELII